MWFASCNWNSTGTTTLSPDRRSPAGADYRKRGGNPVPRGPPLFPVQRVRYSDLFVLHGIRIPGGHRAFPMPVVSTAPQVPGQRHHNGDDDARCRCSVEDDEAPPGACHGKRRPHSGTLRYVQSASTEANGSSEIRRFRCPRMQRTHLGNALAGSLRSEEWCMAAVPGCMDAYSPDNR